MTEEPNYMLLIQGEKHGPLSVKAIYEMKRDGLLPNDAQVIYEGEDWDKATPLNGSPILLARIKQFEEIHSVPVAEHQHMLIQEIRALKFRLVLILWALGLIAVLLMIAIHYLPDLPTVIRLNPHI